jgi:hypothetical protein
MVKEELDIHNFDRRLEKEFEALEKSTISPENKELIKEFIEDLQDGWIPVKGGQKTVGKARWPKYAMHLRVIAQMIHDNGIDPESFLWVDEKKAKAIRKLIIQRAKKNSRREDSWKATAYDYGMIFKKFMRWVREEKRYPKGYPKRGLHNDSLAYSTHPLEVSKLKLPRPKPQGNTKVSDIPTDQELTWLYESAMNPRDRCFFAMWREHGNRIGGIGSLQIGDISPPDRLGILVTMKDKTIDGEQVRFIHAQADIIAYLNFHPQRDNPKAPFWINLEKWNKKGVIEHLEYDDFRKIIQRARDRHNQKYRDNPRKQITKPLRTHIARYTAFRRKRKQGIPAHVICKESGLVDGSKQLEYYGKFDRTDVDEYYKELAKPEEETRPELRSCPRCQQVQKGSNNFCERCGSPMELKTAVKFEEMREVGDVALSELFKDDEVRDVIMKKLAQKPDLIKQLLAA